MASSQRDYLFIKIGTDFPEHPRSLSLSDKAYRHLTNLWCYCARNLTDGIVPRAQILKETTPKTRRELIENGWLVERSDSFEMTKYAERQTTRAEVERRRETATRNGKKGGRPRNPVGNPVGSQNETQSKPEIEIEIEASTDVDAEGARKPSKPPKRATARPSGFAPSQGHHALAIERGVDLMAEFRKFCDWCDANGRTYKDWDAGLRNWLNRARPEQGRRPTRQEETDGLFDRAARLMGVTP